MFYTDFAEDYEKIFPYSDKVYSFLKSYISDTTAEILDIGCATGHYCGKFTSDGLKATGIDLDSQMIETAKHYYADSRFNVLNLTQIAKLNQGFDFVYSTGNVIAHVSPADLNSFLDSLKMKMKQSGIWIFQVINWDYIVTLKEFDFPLIETDSRIFQRKYTDIGLESLIFNTELKNKSDGVSVFKDSVKMYPLSSNEYIKMHKNKGFKLLGHFSDYSKKEYSPSMFSANIFVFQL
jgi:2-polyprenyl-3-methyl-5-hydroxy-6-metoxy-1,4-benzoquinol methylase